MVSQILMMVVSGYLRDHANQNMKKNRLHVNDLFKNYNDYSRHEK